MEEKQEEDRIEQKIIEDILETKAIDKKRQPELRKLQTSLSVMTLG